MKEYFIQEAYKPYKYDTCSTHCSYIVSLQISFCSSVLGEFDEVFLLTADGAPEPVKLHIRYVYICS